MLPFLQQKIGGRKLLVYSESYGLNPRNAARALTNNTGKTLDGGPIPAVCWRGTVCGRGAGGNRCRMGDKRLISYGVDLGNAGHHNLRFVTQAVVREIHFQQGDR